MTNNVSEKGGMSYELYKMLSAFLGSPKFTETFLAKIKKNKHGKIKRWQQCCNSF